jgi:hypothetical protein
MKGRRILGSLLLGGMLLMWSASPAFADGTVSWKGNGSENLEDCGEGGTIHWVFAPLGGTATSATLTVNGDVLSMEKNSPSANDNAARHAFSTFTGSTPTASVSWTGTATRGLLTISDCEPYPPTAGTSGLQKAVSQEPAEAGGIGIPMGVVLLLVVALVAATGPIVRRLVASRS